MSELSAGLIGFGIMLVLMIGRMPIAVAMALVGFGGIAWLSSLPVAISAVKIGPFDRASSYALVTIPLFLLMAFAAARGQMSQGMFRVANLWLGHLRGGLAMATVGSCAGFSAICGSSIATAGAMTSIAYPEMEKANYRPGFSAGVIAAGATLGIMIPPSVILVLYGIITEQSIGRLLMAGIVPGLIEAALFLIAIAVAVRLVPGLAPAANAPAPWSERLRGLLSLWDIGLLFAIVVGGIYFGIVTPMESASLGAVTAVVFGLVRRTLPWPVLREVLVEASTLSAMIFLIIIGADLFGTFIALSQLPTRLALLIADLNVPAWGVLWLIIGVYIVLGALMDELSMILLTIPVFFPLITSLGYDPIWFGIIVVIVAQIGMITPPLGINVFIVSGMVKTVPMPAVFKGVLPLLLAQIVLALLLTIWPSLALYLPNKMF